MFVAVPWLRRSVSRRLLSTEGWIRSQISPCEICGGQTDTGKGFLLSTTTTTIIIIIIIITIITAINLLYIYDIFDK
jgi:hypothetical protein